MNFIRHTNAVNQLYSNLDNLINNNTFYNKKVYMFGSSVIANMIIHYLKKNKIELAGILDNNPNRVGQKVFGLSIFSPKILSDFTDDNVLVLIASGFQDAMIEQLENMGYIYEKHILKVIDLPKLMSDYSFVDRTGYIPLSNEEIKQSQLNVLRKAKQICEENGLRYYLAYGTLLGAVRHKGYIPWDDDIDIYIPAKDMKKFIEKVNADKNFGIVSSFIEMDYYNNYSMMYDCNNICDSNHFPMQITAGITIDIFPLFGLPDDKEKTESYLIELKEAEANMINLLYDTDKCNAARKKLFELVNKYDFDQSPYTGNLFEHEIFSSDWFKEGSDVLFENEKFKAPKEADKYLKAYFGNYWELPPVEKRVGHHFFNAYHQK